nr:Bax inhibitor-1/YccA family protein [Roseospirillum parvum]
MASMQAQERLRAAEQQGLIDQGLRAYMLRVYNYMTGGVALTGLVAYAVAQSPALLNAIHGSGLGIVVALAPLGFILALSFGINRMSTGMAQILFWSFAGVMGLSLSWIFIAYTGYSIAQTFFVTAAAFAGLSLWGYSTKKNLSGFGTFLVMGLIGLIIAMVVNIFLQSAMMQFVISGAGVLIFAGLTAYDTQRIKLTYYEGDGAAVAEKKAIMGATNLYLDFINLFMFLLQFMGNRD